MLLDIDIHAAASKYPSMFSRATHMRSLEPDVLPVGEGNPKDHVMTDIFSVRRDAFLTPKTYQSKPGYMNYTNCPWVSNIEAMQMLEYLTLQADNNESMSVRTSFDVSSQFVFYYVFMFYVYR